MAADAPRIVFETALRSGDGIPDSDVLVVDRDPKLLELTRRIDTSLRVGSAHHKNTDAKADGLIDGALGDTPRAFANGRRDDGCVLLPWVVFAVNKAASTLGGDLTPFSIADLVMLT